MDASLRTSEGITLVGLVAADNATSLPHLLFLLIDDFGWADASWHRPAGYAEVETPNMETLVRTGGPPLSIYDVQSAGAT